MILGGGRKTVNAEETHTNMSGTRGKTPAQDRTGGCRSAKPVLMHPQRYSHYIYTELILHIYYPLDIIVRINIVQELRIIRPVKVIRVECQYTPSKTRKHKASQMNEQTNK